MFSRGTYRLTVSGQPVPPRLQGLMFSLITAWAVVQVMPYHILIAGVVMGWDGNILHALG